MEKLGNDFVGKLLLAAVTANAVKFNGPSNNEKGSVEQAKADAAYMLAFITALTEKKTG